MTLSVDISASSSTQAPVDLVALKARQQQVWASGDFAVVGTTLQIVGESLCEAADLQAGSRVLDVACGNGNATLAAARRFCSVVGLDYVPALLANGRERARAERLPIEFIEGDAEELPFADGSFDVALSTFGVMFAPNQERTAAELRRVVKKGGTIAFANWTPEGFIGGLLRTVGKYTPPPAGVQSPLGWGTEARLAQLFPNVSAVRSGRKNFVFRYLSADHFIDIFRTYYGPTHKAFASLSAEQQGYLALELRELVEKFAAKSTSESVAIPAEYLETVITC
ncbi:MAG: class I SAM-dependent methyltransferase [Polyangiaceae bacterium]|nr:class I SAM-dependent methyltransferase [Polyangiaceae bacterium]